MIFKKKFAQAKKYFVKNNFLHNESFDNNNRKTLLLGLLLARVVILSIIMGVHYFSLIEAKVTVSAYISFFIIFTYIYSLISAIAISMSNSLKLISYIQVISDIFLATAAIYLIGEAGSVVLYFLTIIAAGQIFGISGAIFTAALSGVCYALIAVGLLPYHKTIGHDISRQEILLVYISLVSVAIASSFHSRKIGKILSYARDKELALSELHQKHENLFDTLSEGVILLDAKNSINNLNEAAKNIIGLKKFDESKLIGQNFNRILSSWGADDSNKILEHAEIGIEEVNLKFDSNSKSRHFSCKLKSIENQKGESTGKLFIFSDVSLLKNMEERLSLQEKMENINLTSNLQEKNSETINSKVKMIGESTVMKQIFKLVSRVSKSPASVLINGESGTGKEVIARAIHYNSERENKPFVTINCGAIPENLIESELFGHVKGSFTGAIKDNLGLFRQAQGGTIFLDEIGELPLNLQSKLLRALQEKKVRPVGGDKSIDIDARVLSATNKDLKKEIREKRFREDLYYRLNVINILLPPLRERKEDIPHLINFFIDKYKVNKEAEKTKISSEAIKFLMDYSYPGNIRELENVIERALVLEKKCIKPEHLPIEVRENTSKIVDISHAHNSSKLLREFNLSQNQEFTEIVLLPINLEEELAKMEMSYLKKALEQSSGVKKNAAEMLGLNFRSFRYRLKKYDLGE